MTTKLNFELLNDIIGLEQEKRIIVNHVVVSSEEHKSFPSTLFIGSSGCGKSLLAKTICQILGRDFRELHARILNDKMIFASLLSSVKTKNTCLFLDEVHQLSKIQQETFYPLLDDPNVTILAATTDTGKLLEPFQNRFKLTITLEPYTNKDCMEMAKWYCAKKEISANNQALLKLVECCRNTPRVLFKLIDAAYHKARFIAIGMSSILGIDKDKLTVLDSDVVNSALEDLGIFAHGIEKQELKILSILSGFSYVSLSGLLGHTKVDNNQYANYYEPHLLSLGYITKTTRGRKITTEGTKFLQRVTGTKK